MSVVWQRQGRVAPPSAYGVPGLDPQIRRLEKRVEKDCGWKYPRAPAFRKVVEGGGRRGCSGVSGGDIGWKVAVGGESAQGGGGG